jgi:hypothetical protein
MSDDDERPRKSWRDIDKMRDHSAHRKDERAPAAERKSGRGSQKSYRAALDRLFETGKIAELVEQKTGVAAEEGESRIKLLGRIEKAIDRDSICREVDAYLAQFNELPEDLEILGKILEHRDPELQRRAMEVISRLLEREQPKRRRTMVAQLKIIRDAGYDKEMVALATSLLQRLD